MKIEKINLSIRDLQLQAGKGGQPGIFTLSSPPLVLFPWILWTNLGEEECKTEDDESSRKNDDSKHQIYYSSYLSFSYIRYCLQRQMKIVPIENLSPYHVIV